MKKGDLLGVYGTLRRGERADISKNVLIHSMSFMGMDEVNGKMYHIGAFPGVKLVVPPECEFDPSLPAVKVEVYHVGDQSCVTILDHYEGYHNDDPEGGLYDRHQVFTKKGRVLWLYTYNPSVHEDQFIETGDWKNPRLIETHRIPRTGELK